MNGWQKVLGAKKWPASLCGVNWDMARQEQGTDPFLIEHTQEIGFCQPLLLLVNLHISSTGRWWEDSKCSHTSWVHKISVHIFFQKLNIYMVLWLFPVVCYVSKYWGRSELIQLCQNLSSVVKMSCSTCYPWSQTGLSAPNMSLFTKYAQSLHPNIFMVIWTPQPRHHLDTSQGLHILRINVDCSILS